MWLLAPLLVAACAADETISGYAPDGVVYRLTELDGAPYRPRATISFPEKGSVSGSGPCNIFSGRQTVPYPWFQLEALVATERGCADLAAEASYFAALVEMTLAETQGDVLILSNEAGREMVFRAE